jgi:hypothetical protein
MLPSLLVFVCFLSVFAIQGRKTHRRFRRILAQIFEQYILMVPWARALATTDASFEEIKRQSWLR